MTLRLFGLIAFTLCTFTFLRADLPATRPSAQVEPATIKLGAMSLTGESFGGAIERLRDATQTTIFVNWKALEASKVGRDTLVTIDLSNLSLREALEKLLGEIGGEHVRLKYVVEEGVISVTTAEDLAMNVVTRVYDIRGALKDKGPREAQVEVVIKQVRGIDPLSWKEAGGKIASVRELAGQLIVTQTEDVQRRIVAFLKRYGPGEEFPVIDSKR